MMTRFASSAGTIVSGSESGTQMTQDTTKIARVTAPRDRRRWRAIASLALIVSASVLLPLAGATVWVRNLVLDRSRYVETIAPLAKNQAVREAVARRVSTELAATLEIDKRAARALPETARFLAAPIAPGAQLLVQTTALKILESPAFARTWRSANQRAHDQIVNALTGRRGTAVTSADGKVVLNLRPLGVSVAKRLAALGVGLPKNMDASRVNARFVLVDSKDLVSVQNYAKLLDRLGWALPLLAVILYGLAVLAAPDRRKGVLRVGIGVTLAMVISLLAYRFARTTYLDGLPSAVQSTAAAAAIFDTVTRFVHRGFQTMLVIGLLVWLCAWMTGPSRGAEALRRQRSRVMRNAGANNEGNPAVRTPGAPEDISAS